MSPTKDTTEFTAADFREYLSPLEPYTRRPGEAFAAWARRQLAELVECAADPDLNPVQELAVGHLAHLLRLPTDGESYSAVALVAVDRPATWERFKRDVARVRRLAVLGPGWHRVRDGLDRPLDHEPPDDKRPEDVLLAAATYAAEIDLLRGRFPRRPKVHALLALLRAEPALYGDREELARRLGDTRNNVDQLIHEAKRLAAI